MKKRKLILALMEAVNEQTKAEHFAEIHEDVDEITFSVGTSVSVVLEYATDIARLLNLTLHERIENGVIVHSFLV